MVKNGKINKNLNLHIDHAMKIVLRKRWTDMWRRCHQDHNPSFEGYGKKGIEVCEHWWDVNNFIADVGARPGGVYRSKRGTRWIPEYTLDRIDNSKGYEPSNVKWSTYSEQNTNKNAPRKPRRLSKLDVIAIYLDIRPTHVVAKVYGVGTGTICNIKNAITHKATTAHLRNQA